MRTLQKTAEQQFSCWFPSSSLGTSKLRALRVLYGDLLMPNRSGFRGYFCNNVSESEPFYRLLATVII
jgi:hypothetical protein